MSEIALVPRQARHDGHRRRRPSNTVNPVPDWRCALVGTSVAMRRVHELISRVAPADSTVLICGESGTGKELAARYIHQASHRVDAPFITINCAALTETLLESELFGHERGAFMGAQEQKKGKFELADGGTLFLDEIGALTPGLQTKLLGVLEERQFERVGGLRPIRIDVRLIAATNTDLQEAVSLGAFRPDLYYRLKVISLTMPPLREHPEDIALLVNRFVQEFGRWNGHRVTSVSSETLSLLMSHTWPGNVRELRNAIEHACVTGTSDVILPHDLPEDILRRPRFITTPEKWRQIEALYHATRECTPEDRPALLAQVEPELRAEIEALLAQKDSGEIIDRPAVELLDESRGTFPLTTGTRLESADAAAWHCDIIGKTISHYRILEKLGEGGMGVVYKAKDTRLERTVALKVPVKSALGSKDEKVRFLRGVRAAAALNHPNICTIHDLDEKDGQPFIVMEYVAGKPLRQKTERKPLKLDESLRLAIEIGRGLEAAHKKGIVHRDIKSSNIMIMPDGRPKIMDFGLARLMGLMGVTRTGTVLGTPAYMSPEQAQGKAADRRSDLWSLGVVLYEMVTGQLPFRRDSEAAVVHSILNDDPEPVTALRAGLPRELDRVIGKALAKRPEERYQQIGDLLVDLQAVRGRLPSEEPEEITETRSRQPVEPHARAVTLYNGHPRMPSACSSAVEATTCVMTRCSQRSFDPRSCLRWPGVVSGLNYWTLRDQPV